MSKSPPLHRRLGAVAAPVVSAGALLAALTLAACGDVPTAASSPAVEPSVGLELPTFSVATTEIMTAMLADINDRIIPSLPDGSARTALADAFGILALAVGGTPDAHGAVHDPRAALTAATAALTAYGAVVANDPEAPAELESIKLGLGLIALTASL